MAKTMLRGVLFLILFGLGHYGAAGAGEAPATLAALEAALTADPDNLRLGTQYRQAVIQAEEYDRGIQFFEKLVAEAPASANAHLNFGFAYVDKIPVAGSITQVILANSALGHFTDSLQRKPSWLGYYTRGNSYLYWPKIFGRTPLGIADLEAAMKLQKAEPKRSFHVRTYVALGDGYWKMDEVAKARAVWAEGLMQFPQNPALKFRLSKDGEELKTLIDSAYDVTRRVDTSLDELFAAERSDSR